MLIQFVLWSTLRPYLCTNENKTGYIHNNSVIKAYPKMQQSTDKHESQTFIQNSSMRYWLNPLSATEHAVDVYRPTFFSFKMSSSWLFSSSMFPIHNIGSTGFTYILHYLYIVVIPPYAALLMPGNSSYVSHNPSFVLNSPYKSFMKFVATFNMFSSTGFYILRTHDIHLWNIQPAFSIAFPYNLSIIYIRSCFVSAIRVVSSSYLKFDNADSAFPFCRFYNYFASEQFAPQLRFPFQMTAIGTSPLRCSRPWSFPRTRPDCITWCRDTSRHPASRAAMATPCRRTAHTRRHIRWAMATWATRTRRDHRWWHRTRGRPSSFRMPPPITRDWRGFTRDLVTSRTINSRRRDRLVTAVVSRLNGYSAGYASDVPGLRLPLAWTDTARVTPVMLCTWSDVGPTVDDVVEICTFS